MGKETDEQYTPKFIFDALKIQFDFDVSAPIGGSPFVPCNAYFTKNDDGLSQEWVGKIWMNPPFSEGTKWHQRFQSHNNGIALAPMSKAKWFYDYWTDKKFGILMPTPHLKFRQPNGTDKGIFIPIVLIAAGEECNEALRNSALGLVR